MVEIVGSPERITAHVAGVELTVEGRYLRQRCSWCGAILCDYDLTLTMVPEGQRGPSGWQVGAWIEIEGTDVGHLMRVVEQPDGKFPPNSCMAQEITPPPRIVAG